MKLYHSEEEFQAFFTTGPVVVAFRVDDVPATRAIMEADRVPTIRVIDVVMEASLHRWQRKVLETVQWRELIRDGTRVVESGEVLLGKLLNGGNHLPQFLSFQKESLTEERDFGLRIPCLNKHA